MSRYMNRYCDIFRHTKIYGYISKHTMPAKYEFAKKGNCPSTGSKTGPLDFRRGELPEPVKGCAFRAEWGKGNNASLPSPMSRSAKLPCGGRAAMLKIPSFSTGLPMIHLTNISKQHGSQILFPLPAFRSCPVCVPAWLALTGPARVPSSA